MSLGVGQLLLGSLMGGLLGNKEEEQPQQPTQVASNTQQQQQGGKVPLCMVIEKLRTVLKSSAPHLTDEETENAMKELFNPSFASLEFPRVMRTRVDPPLAQQNFCVFTFTPSVSRSLNVIPS